MNIFKKIFGMKKTAKKAVKSTAKKTVKTVKKVVKKSAPKRNIEMDEARKAKAVGYRFRGKGIYRKPTAEEIKQGWGEVNGKVAYVYNETRPTKSDVNLRKRL